MSDRPECGYRCEAISKEGFLSQLIRYVSTGHYFYFAHVLKPGKDPQVLDRKIIDRFGLDAPKWKRWRRPPGTPSIHYLRFDRTYVIFATHGRTVSGEMHPLFREYPGQIRDIRKQSLAFHGYSIRYAWSEEKSKRRVNIRLDRETYAALRTELLQMAIRPQFESRETFERFFLARARDYQPYGPIHRQIELIRRAVNHRRRRASYPPIRKSRTVPTFLEPGRVFVTNPVQDTKFDEAAHKAATHWQKLSATSRIW